MLETKPFDAARHMTSPMAQQELLDDAFASGNTPISPMPLAS